MLFYLVIIVLVVNSGATFSDWNDWSACSAACGKGVKTRERILKPGNNDSCYSAIIEKQTCHVECNRLTNLAINKTATASSRFLKAYPSGNAIDGITNANLYGKSCMHTAKDKNPWLRIDLGGVRVVEKVVVHNRADCCTERLNNLEVTVGVNADGNGNKVCGKRENMTNVNIARFHCCDKIFGRYVHLQIPGPQFLHVCEVEVLGANIKNIALNKKATQSSTGNNDYTNYGPNIATDDQINQYTHTNNEANPWWRVDLEKDAVIHKVVLVGYDNAGNYVKDAKVTVRKDSAGNTIGNCGTADSTNVFIRGGYSVYNVTCPKDLTGRYVQVQLTRTDNLVMREVEIHGYYT